MSYRVEITGNVGFINEKRVVGKDNKSVIEFGVIVNHPKKDEKGEYRKDSPSTLQVCEAWEYLADNIEESLSVGDRVVVVGNLVTGEDYVSKDGETVTPKPKVRAFDIATSLQFATVEVTKSKGGSSKPAEKKATTKTSAKKKAAKPAANNDEFDDDVFDADDDFL